TIDRIDPTGSIIINGGATVTNNTNVTLTLTGNDASLPLQMAFSVNAGSYSVDEAFATTKAFTLPAGDGLKTVTLRLKDAAGNTSLDASNITLDATPPTTTILTNPSVLSTSSSASFTFTSDDINATFEGSLDGGGYAPVTSPVTFSGLADG